LYDSMVNTCIGRADVGVA
jgi:hypothetical protein